MKTQTAPTLAQCTTLTDDQLLSRVVKYCRSTSERKGVAHLRWVAVMENFGLGSTTSRALCRRYDLNPDEMVKR